MIDQDNKKETGFDRTAETTNIGISWVRYAHRRSDFKKTWPSIWNLQVVTDPFVDILKGFIFPESILDVGATDKVWKPQIQSLWPTVCYRSLDIDRTNKHDYYSFDDVETKFDLVICFEVLEHLKPNECQQMIRDCVNVSKPGKFVLFSVPNLLSDSYWMDFTHQTALTFWDLPTLMSFGGLEIVKGARWFRGTTKRRLLHKYLFYPLHRVINKDFSQSILMLGRKPLEHE